MNKAAQRQSTLRTGMAEGAAGLDSPQAESFDDFLSSSVDPWSSAAWPDFEETAWAVAPFAGTASDSAAFTASAAVSCGATETAALAPVPAAATLGAGPASRFSEAMVEGGASAGGFAATTDVLTGTGGSSALQADKLRAAFGVDGSGIKVGVLSDSFNVLGGAAADYANGNLPAGGVSVLAEGVGTDEGRAMLELVHQIAPGAQLYFATADGGDQNFANNITALRNAGCNIIIDDMTYYDEPMFQPGVISQAIDNATASGALYFTAAGNDANNAYQSAWRGASGDTLFNFNASGGTATTQTVDVTVTPNAGVMFDLQWAQPFSSPSSSFNIEATDQYGDVFSAAAEGGVNYGGRAVTLLDVTDPFAATTSLSLSLSIQKLGGPDPSLIKYAALGDGLPVSIADQTAGNAPTGTVIGHHEDPNAVTVAAADAASSALESFSSSGAGTAWLFDANGTPISDPIAKVDLTGADGITTDVLGDFYGTSAAAPTAAAVAALLEQLAPGASAGTIEAALKSTATNLGEPSALQGAGLVNALAAGDALVPTTSLLVAQEQTIGAAQQVALSSLFSATVAIGQVAQYHVYEGSLTTPVGKIAEAGSVLPDYQSIAASSLAGFVYTGSNTTGTDRLWVQALANGGWGNWAYVDMKNTGAGAPVTTILVTQEQTVGPRQSVALSSLFSTSGPGGEPITQYNVYEGSPSGATVGSVTDASGRTLPTFTNDTVTSLAGITYHSASAAGTDRLWVQADAGGSWGNWAYVDMNDTGAPPPQSTALVAQEQTIGPQQGVALSTLFSATDALGDPITQYNIYEGSPNGVTVGTITNASGSTLPTFTDDPVTSLAGVTYHSSTSAGTDRLWIQAYADGQWGNWVYVDMNNTGGVPPVSARLVAQEQTIAPSQSVTLASLFSATEASQDPITRYDVYEGSFGTPVGTISDNGGNTLATFRDNLVSSLAGLAYHGSATPGTDRLWLRAYADNAWGNWTYVDMSNTGSSGTATATSGVQVSQLAQAMAAFAPVGSASAPPLISAPPAPALPTLLATASHH